MRHGLEETLVVLLPKQIQNQSNGFSQTYLKNISPIEKME